MLVSLHHGGKNRETCFLGWKLTSVTNRNDLCEDDISSIIFTTCSIIYENSTTLQASRQQTHNSALLSLPPQTRTIIHTMTEITKEAERCSQQVAFYHSRFPKVAKLSSTELDHLQDFLLIDVRTAPEQRISILPQAIPLSDLPPSLPPTTPLITYCTIGYRSSLEAQRLQRLYPENPVYSLDGILAYAHGRDLWDPTRQSTTRRVHAFGRMWKSCAPRDCSVDTFTWALLPRMLQVAGMVVHRFVQECCEENRCGDGSSVVVVAVGAGGGSNTADGSVFSNNYNKQEKKKTTTSDTMDYNKAPPLHALSRSSNSKLD